MLKSFTAICALICATAATAAVTLTPEQRVCPQSTQGRASAQRARSKGNTHMLIADFPINSGGIFYPGTNNYSAFGTTVRTTEQGDSVYLSRILDFAGYGNIIFHEIGGSLEATTGILTVTIPEGGLNVAEFDLPSGERATCYLYGCEWYPHGFGSREWDLDFNDKVQFRLEDDGSLSSLNSYILWGGSSDDSQGIFGLYNGCGAYPVSGSPMVTAQRHVTVQQPTIRSLSCLSIPMFNISEDPITLDVEIEGPSGLTLEGSKVMSPSFADGEYYDQEQPYTISVSSETPAAKHWEVTFKDAFGDALSRTVDVDADFQSYLPYDECVKGGAIKFVKRSDEDWISFLPFTLGENEDGTKALVADGVDKRAVTAICAVPQGKVGLLFWKGVTNASLPNGLQVQVHGSDNYVFDDTKDMTHNGVFDAWDASGVCMLDEGEQLVDFTFRITQNWYESGVQEYPSSGRYYDFELKTFDKTDDAAMYLGEGIDCGALYKDRLDAQGQASIELMNLGSNPLKVLGSTGAPHFAAVVDGVEAATLTNLPVVIRFNGDILGEYAETLTVHTTGGDIEVPCRAMVESIPKDYSIVVTEGDVSFDTSHEYPFGMDRKRGKVFSSNSGDKPAKDSWLEASFVVPEGKEADIEWTGNNDSIDPLYLMGDEIFLCYTSVVIDGEEIARFAGQNVAASSADVVEDYLHFTTPGRHSVKFVYVKKTSDIAGADSFELTNLKLHLRDSAGVWALKANSHPTMVEYYSITGSRLDAPQCGVTIVRTTMSDGTVKVTKAISK